MTGNNETLNTKYKKNKNGWWLLYKTERQDKSHDTLEMISWFDHEAFENFNFYYSIYFVDLYYFFFLLEITL